MEAAGPGELTPAVCLERREGAAAPLAPGFVFYLFIYFYRKLLLVHFCVLIFILLTFFKFKF